MTRVERLLGLDRPITRRDFLGGALLGAGASLLGVPAPASGAEASAKGKSTPAALGPDWTGPGGAGDYRLANGNTHEVVNAAHSLRTGELDKGIGSATDTGERYDLAIVGCGFAGLSAAYTFRRERSGATVLMLDNHAIFGGEAKQNEFEVDGHRLWGPQGSTGHVVSPLKPRDAPPESPYWRMLGLPDPEDFAFQAVSGSRSGVRVPRDVWRPMHNGWADGDQGWYFEGKGWVKNPWSNALRSTPLPPDLREELVVAELYRHPPRRENWLQWLDSITYQEFLSREVGVSERAGRFFSPVAAAMGCGLGADVISALSALEFPQPGVNAFRRLAGYGNPAESRYVLSFPGGNAGVARHYVKLLMPGAIEGGSALTEILFNPVRFSALDRPGERLRMRLGATVVSVRHGTDGVELTYLRDGAFRRCVARQVVMASGQWINKHVARDAPEELRHAMGEFHHAPILTVNVAIRHWRHFDRLGIASARWFEGFGWFTSLRRQLILDGREAMPLHPDKPTVLTLFIPFLVPGLPVEQQAVAARARLLAMSFRDIERLLREQFARMFSAEGFDPARDIAGIVANRWGHAYVVQPPGFYYGRDGKLAAREVVRKGYGRIAFAHSELQGAQSWIGAAEEGERAARQLLATA